MLFQTCNSRGTNLSRRRGFARRGTILKYVAFFNFRIVKNNTNTYRHSFSSELLQCPRSEVKARRVGRQCTRVRQTLEDNPIRCTAFRPDWN